MPAVAFIESGPIILFLVVNAITEPILYSHLAIGIQYSW